LGEITVDLRLVFTIPGTRLTINSLVLGLKEASPQIMATILTTLLEGIEERAVERKRSGALHQKRPPKQAAQVQLLDM
jgi:hypothetical protein